MADFNGSDVYMREEMENGNTFKKVIFNYLLTYVLEPC